MSKSFRQSILEEYEMKIHNRKQEDASFLAEWFLREKQEDHIEAKKKEREIVFNSKINESIKNK